MGRNYYDILGVDKNATQDEIKKAYRELSKKYHPDRQDGNEDKFKEIGEAYSVLGDKEKKAQYDAQSSYGNFDYTSFRDAFNRDSFYGGFNMYASDTISDLTITIDEGYYGCSKRIRVGNKLISINVPKGATNGMKLRVAGYGKFGFDRTTHQKRTGDLIVTIKIQNDSNKWFSSDGTLEVAYSVNWIDAILGGEASIKVFDRDVRFNIPKFTQNGGYIILSNCGYRKCNSEDSFGMLKVNFVVSMPRTLTDGQIELMKKIKESL